jgi:hypothetical protein
MRSKLSILIIKIISLEYGEPGVYRSEKLTGTSAARLGEPGRQGMRYAERKMLVFAGHVLLARI